MSVSTEVPKRVLSTVVNSAFVHFTVMATMYQRAAMQGTGAGALSDFGGVKVQVDGKNAKVDVIRPRAPYDDTNGSPLNEALINWSVTQGRVFVVRVTLSFLYATGVLAFLGFLSTLGADSASGDHESDRKKRYLCALSVVVNMVAVAHYKLITKIRSYDFGGSNKGEVFAGLEWTAFSKHNDKVAIGVEMAIDGIRHSDWLITLIFLIYKIYYLAGVEADGVTPKTGDIFETPAAAAGCAVLMVVLSAIVRIGTDEIWDYKKNMWSTVIAAVLWAASLLLMILLVVDIDTAVEANKGIINVDLYKSFYLIWIGYPLVSLFSIGTRFIMACTRDNYTGDTPEWLSFTKDLSYGFLDSWSKGVFALWTAYTAFHMHLLQAPAAASLN